MVVYIMRTGLTKELAEILGMFAADGSLQEDHICMWGNIYEEREYYDEIVCKLFSQVFNKEIHAHEKKSNSVYGFYVCDRNVVRLLKELGFSKNKTHIVKVPKEIIQSKDPKVIAAFIRGFVDCDGCLTFMKRREKGYSKFKRKFHAYPRILIGGVSKRMIEDLSYLLKDLKMEHSLHIKKSKKINEKDQGIITIRGKTRLEKWNKLIGFNNHSKTTKYFVWKRFGFCPTNINIKQRQSILNNELNPYDFYKETI